MCCSAQYMCKFADVLTEQIQDEFVIAFYL